jgi:hypothetical protein
MRFKILAATFLGFVVMSGAGVAQTGSITGQVLDPTGAAVVNAKIRQRRVPQALPARLLQPPPESTTSAPCRPLSMK